MSYVNKISVKGNTYDVNDAEARANIDTLTASYTLLENTVTTGINGLAERVTAVEAALEGGQPGSGDGIKVVVSETEPPNPTNGTIWVMPLTF